MKNNDKDTLKINIKKEKFETYILNHNITSNECENIKYITYPIYENILDENGKEEILAIYSTRCGGYSIGDSKGLNLKEDLDTSKENFINNYKLLSKVLDFDYKKLTFSNQKHETNIKIIKDADIGKGIIKELDYSSVDGIMTDIKNVPLVTFYADCTPIYIYDKLKKVIGMFHGGWRGTVSDIAGKAIDKFKEEFNSNTNDLIAVIGPSICKSCYEVSEDVLDEVIKLLNKYKIKIDETLIKDKHIDLKQINKNVLMKKGVSENNICVSNLCTKCSEELFYSHRRSGFKRGSQAAIMMIR